MGLYSQTKDHILRIKACEYIFILYVDAYKLQSCRDSTVIFCSIRFLPEICLNTQESCVNISGLHSYCVQYSAAIQFFGAKFSKAKASFLELNLETQFTLPNEIKFS